MVVFEDGKPRTGEYRRFRIRTVARTGDRGRLANGDIVENGSDAWGNRVFERVGSSTTSRIPKSVWNKLAEQVRSKIQLMIDSLLKERRSVLFG